MALTNNQITAKNLKGFYDRIYPYLGVKPSSGFTPVGTVITVMGTTPPEHYVECNGQELLINSYLTLAGYFNDQFGASNYFGGNGTSTFAVPDLRSSEVSDAMFCIAIKNIYIETIEKQTYSTTEQVVGTWIDGKPIYQKTINFGALPNATSKTVAHGISNIDRITSYDAIMSDGTDFQTLNCCWTNGSNNIRSSVNKTNVTITSTYNVTGYNAYVTIQYTKTTD